MNELTIPILLLGTLSKLALFTFPRQNLAVFLSFLKDWETWARTIGPMDISFQYSTVAAHNLRTSVP